MEEVHTPHASQVIVSALYSWFNFISLFPFWKVHNLIFLFISTTLFLPFHHHPLLDVWLLEFHVSVTPKNFLQDSPSVFSSLIFFQSSFNFPLPELKFYLDWASIGRLRFDPLFLIFFYPALYSQSHCVLVTSGLMGMCMDLFQNFFLIPGLN